MDISNQADFNDTITDLLKQLKKKLAENQEQTNRLEIEVNYLRNRVNQLDRLVNH